MFCFIFSHFQCFVEGQQRIMRSIGTHHIHIKNKREDSFVAVVPKTGVPSKVDGMQFQQMLILHFPENVRGFLFFYFDLSPRFLH